MPGWRRPAPRLCRVCGFAMDPVLADEDEHMNCQDPKQVPLWRRKGALRLTPEQLAGYTPPPPDGEGTTEGDP